MTNNNSQIIEVTREAAITEELALEPGDRIQIVKEDYGWEIQRGSEWEAFEDALEVFGAEKLAEELARAMGNQELGENLAFIFRNWDYRSPYLAN
jgi:hypothetical protein